MIKLNTTRFLDAFLSMLRSSYFTKRPFFLAHAVTYGCNSKCKTCTYWQMSHRMKEDLSTREVFELLDEAYDFGMRGYYLFGGEPLVRKDIGDIVRYAKNKGFLTVMNTNGSLAGPGNRTLWENLDFAFISLDYFNSYHDSIRGRRGSFDEVMKCIGRIREVNTTLITFVATISKLNYDAIEPMAKLSRDMRVGISYNAVEPTVESSFEEGWSYSPVNEYGLSKEQLQSFYSALLRLKSEGYPLMETDYVLRHYVEGEPFICHFPKIFVYVSPDKKIYNCTLNHVYDLRKGSFQDYFSGPLYREHVKMAEGCNSCVRTCVRMYSYAYTLKPMNFMNLYDIVKILINQKTKIIL
ncbi:MAG TPA: radical SAM protein [Candidatus Bathyarchaeia archaeon]|nr:radical SAM protein [Candidatus Bathyarchaeia archaeon]